MNTVNKMKWRKQRAMLVLPAFVIPFLTLAFWTLGGGKVVEGKVTQSAGLNLHLPDPKAKKETVLDKLGFYEQADRDSVKLERERKNDPYYQEPDDEQQVQSTDELEAIVKGTAGKYHQPGVTDQLNPSPYQEGTGDTEKKLMEKIAKLNKVISEPDPDQSYTVDDDGQGLKDKHLEDLEGMMQSLNQRDEGDPELDKLSSMMDKILDIQHPERIKEKMKSESEQEDAGSFIVSSKSSDDTLVNGFYSLDNETDVEKANAIKAVVNEDQSLVDGAVIKLRLVSDAYIKGVKIPAGHFVFGIVSLEGERLKIDIQSIREGSSLYPVKMEVYDMDGLPGIYIPGAINRDVARQSADNNLQTLQLSSLDPSLAAQATTAGIGVVKNLLSKKVKLVKVMVKPGYKVLLKNKGTP